MGLSFRKSFKIGKNTRINISEHGGIGFSTGVKGFRVSKNRQGTRFTFSRNGIYYTKWFTKKNKLKKNKEQEKEKEEPINLETDYERIPTDDEETLYRYIGSRERNYLLYILVALLIGFAVYGYIVKTPLSYVYIGVVILLLGLYLFKSKLNYYIFTLNHSIRLFNNDKFIKAYNRLNKCLEIKPNSDKALMLMMFTTFELEKFEETIEYINRYKKDNKALEVMDFMAGCAYVEIGEYQKALEAIEKVYSKEADIKYSKYKILGDCYVGLGDYDQAINWYRKCPVNDKDINESLMEYKYAIGKAYLLDNKKKKAFKYLSVVYDYQSDYKDVKELLQKT